jgi:hypothetical protein
MLNSTWKFATLGGRHAAAATMYLGLGLMLWGLLPGPAPLLAGCDGPEEGCSPGYMCCHGSCVPEDYICCEDGSAGPAGECLCCTNCAESTCTDPPTLICPTLEDCPDQGGGEHEG